MDGSLEKHYKENYKRYVKQYSRRCNGNVEDVVQEGYANALTHLQNHEVREQTFNVWMNSVIHNAFRDYLRDLYNNGMSVEFDEEDDFIPRNPSLEEQNELLEDLYTLVEGKVGVKKEVLLLALRGGYTNEEISSICKIHRNSVMNYINELKREARELWNLQ